jgi:hypothetical protein
VGVYHNPRRSVVVDRTLTPQPRHLAASLIPATDVVDSWLEENEQEGRDRAKVLWRVIRPDPDRDLDQRMTELRAAYDARVYPNDHLNVVAWARLPNFRQFVYDLAH